MICTLYYGCFSLHLDSLLYTYCFPPSTHFNALFRSFSNCVYWNFTEAVNHFGDSHDLNWSRIVTSIDLLKCKNLATLSRAQAAK